MNERCRSLYRPNLFRESSIVLVWLALRNQMPNNYRTVVNHICYAPSLSITISNAILIEPSQFSRPFPLRKLLIAPLFARPQHRLKLFPFFLLPLHCKDLVLRHSEVIPFCGSARGSDCLLTFPTVLSVRPLSVVIPPNANGC